MFMFIYLYMYRYDIQGHINVCVFVCVYGISMISKLFCEEPDCN